MLGLIISSYVSLQSSSCTAVLQECWRLSWHLWSYGVIKRERISAAQCCLILETPVESWMFRNQDVDFQPIPHFSCSIFPISIRRRNEYFSLWSMWPRYLIFRSFMLVNSCLSTLAFSRTFEFLSFCIHAILNILQIVHILNASNQCIDHFFSVHVSTP